MVQEDKWLTFGKNRLKLVFGALSKAHHRSLIGECPSVELNITAQFRIMIDSNLVYLKV